MNTRIHTVLVAILLSSVIHAQTEVGYQRGSTQAEDILPPSPEAASVVKYAGVPFTHSLGTAEYEVPLYTLKGHQLEIPISLRYRSNGIKVDEIAGVAGLGWSLEAGGCVTREVVYMPDEFNNWYFYTRPSGSLLTDLVNLTWSDQAQLFIGRTFRNQHDANSDRYSYSVAGLSGTFIVTPDREIIQLNGDGVNIDAIQSQGYNGPITSFRITGPDGTVYVFSEREVSTRQNQPVESPTINTGQQVNWSATTAWYLTSITSADQRESASFTYASGGTWNLDSQDYYQKYTNRYGEGNDQHSEDPSDLHRKSVRLQSSCDTKALSSITLRGTTVSFEYQNAGGTTMHKSFDRPHLNNFPRRLSGVTVTSSALEELVSYEILTEKETNDGRIILTGVNEYHDNILTDRWSFNYKTLPHLIWRYSQDWFGYYNKENLDDTIIFNPLDGEDPETGPGGLIGVVGPGANLGVDHGDGGGIGGDSGDSGGSSGGNSGNTDPDRRRPRHNLSPFKVQNVAGKYGVTLKFGTPVPDEADYMSMTEANHDGAKTCFEYEGASLVSSGYQDHYIGLRVKRITVKDNDTVCQTKHFTYDEPSFSGLTSPSGDYITLYLEGTASQGLLTPALNWHYTVHESSTSAGLGLSGSRAVYGKVTELVSSSPDDSTGVKTEYYYDVGPARHGGYSVSERFPSYVMNYYQNGESGNGQGGSLAWLACSGYVMNDPVSSALLTCRKNYRMTADGEEELYSSEEYIYSNPREIMVLTGYQSVELMNSFDGTVGGISPQRFLHYPVYTRARFGQSPLRITKVGYHSSGNDTTIVNYSYVSRPTLDKPIRQAMVSVDGSDVKRVVTYEYPDTTSLSGTWINWLRADHRLKDPIRQNYIRIVDQDTTSTVTRKVEYGQFSGHLQLKKVQEFTDGAESWREEVFTRDNYGNVTSLKERGKPKMSVTWTNDGMYPASITNGEGSIAQTSTYTWIPGIGLASETTPQGIITSYEYDSAGRLARIKDTDGNTVEEYTYNLLGDVFGRKNIRKKTFLSGANTQYRTDVSWYNSLGMKTQETAVDATSDGRSLVSSFEGDYLLHDDVKSWLPFPTDALSGLYISNAQATSTTYHQSDEAYHYKGYEESSREKVESTSLPGYFAHKNKFSDDVRSDYPRYVWVDGAGVTQNGVYPSSEVLTEVSTDADGKVKTTITDRFGNILGTEYGSGTDRTTSSTRVYDNKGRLRAVIGGGIAITDSLNMWRYSYDALGRVSSKGIPGSIRESYTYDNEDRVISMAKGNEYTEYVYDAQGRLTHRYLTVGNGSRHLMEKHEYDTRSQDSAMFLVIISQSLSGTVQNCGLTGMETLSKYAIIDENGAVDGYATTSYAYDKLGRQYRKVTMRTGHNSGFLSEECRYDFRGNVTKSAIKNGDNIGGWDILQTNSQYDTRDRLTRTISSLSIGGTVAGRDTTLYSYDELGRLASTTSSCGNKKVKAENGYTLQGFLAYKRNTIGGKDFFSTSLTYDAPPIGFDSPTFTGRISGKIDSWKNPAAPAFITLAYMFTEGYSYDSAGRLQRVGRYSGAPMQGHTPSIDGEIYNYDARGNIKKYSIFSDDSTTVVNSFSYRDNRLLGIYEGNVTDPWDRLPDIILPPIVHPVFPTVHTGGHGGFNPPEPGGNFEGGTQLPQDYLFSFVYDDRGRMIHDGMEGTEIQYNHMDLPAKITRDSTDLAKYSYLADGTKISAMDSTGTCYRYYGPMVYTVGINGNKSFESVSIPTGRISSSGVRYHVTDHLGSVRAVVNGNTGALIETSNYSIYGARSAGFMSVTSSSPETRYRFTGKEDQSPAFGISYTDFGARHYSPNLRRWLVPDPLSEQYYDVSPYAYCAGDPVNLVDEDGRDFRKKRRFNTYTITAIYYVNNQESYKSASQGISFWNRRTNDTYTDESGRTFNIKYNLTVRQIDQKHSPQLGDNTFEVNDERVKANDIDKKGIVGVTLNANEIYVKRNYSIKNPNTNRHSSTPAHEIGHTLGMKHKSSGIMSERQDEARTGMVSDDNIHEMMTSQSGEDEKIGILTTLYEKIRELF